MQELQNLSLEELNDLKTKIEEIISERQKATLPENSIKISIAKGYVDQRDLSYEEHRRSTNYVATVKFDPSQPGGLSREFWAKGSGSFKGVPESLTEGAVIEIAHDYTSSGGNRNRRRDFYTVLAVDPDFLLLLETRKPTK